MKRIARSLLTPLALLLPAAAMAQVLGRRALSGTVRGEAACFAEAVDTRSPISLGPE